MAGHWSKIIPQQCVHYTRFMSKLSLAQANFIFWSSFVFVLVLLVVSAVQYQKLLSFKNDIDNGVLACNQARHYRKLRLLRLNLGTVIISFFFATVAVVLESFCLFNIEFCQGEDLIQLYWGVWSVLQLGSLIAILGVALHFWITLSTIETPGWAIALGTPVLVFAAIGWIFTHFGHQFWLRCSGSRRAVDSGGAIDREGENEDEKDEESNEKFRADRWFSRANRPAVVGTQQNDSTSARGLTLTASDTCTSSRRDSMRRNSIF